MWAISIYQISVTYIWLTTSLYTETICFWPNLLTCNLIVMFCELLYHQFIELYMPMVVPCSSSHFACQDYPWSNLLVSCNKSVAIPIRKTPQEDVWNLWLVSDRWWCLETGHNAPYYVLPLISVHNALFAVSTTWLSGYGTKHVRGAAKLRELPPAW